MRMASGGGFGLIGPVWARAGGVIALGAAVCLGPAVGAQGDTAGAEGEECRLALPPGQVQRFELEAPDRLVVRIAGTPGSEIAGACVRGVRVDPPMNGHSLIRIDITPGTFQAVDLSGQAAVLIFRPKHVGEPGVYRIGPNDILTVSVPSHGIVRDVTVDSDGTIPFEVIGQVPVADMTLAEATRLVHDRLDAGYLKNPDISITVKEYASQYVFVTGQVRKPGKVYLRGSTTLKDVLAEAGGFDREASDELVVTRAHADGKPEVFRFTRTSVEGDLTNLVLAPGDEVHIPQRRYFFIQGEVQLPNRYEYSTGLTLMQSIAIANGLKEWANRREIRILRTGSGGGDKMVFDLRDIERQKSPDPLLQPGDIVIVPRRLM